MNKKIIPIIIISLLIPLVVYAGWFDWFWDLFKPEPEVEMGATILHPFYGGLGRISFDHGDLVYFSSTTDIFESISTGTDGYVLTLVSNVPAWAVSVSGGGSASTAWSTTTVGSTVTIYPDNATDVVILGGNATTSSGYIFEVIGNSLIDDILGVNATFTRMVATNFIGTLTGSATDLSCTDCINATEIEDIYILKAGYSTGNLTSDLNIDSNTFVISYDDNLVGIGTNAPAEALHIGAGNILLDNTQQIRIKDAGGTENNVLTLTSAIYTDELVLGSGSGIDNLSLATNGIRRLFIDNTGNVGIGTSTDINNLLTVGTTIGSQFLVDSSGNVTTTGRFVFSLPADKNITIDARTNPRTITMGAMRWNHTPEASTLNTRALFLDIDANSVPNTQGLHIDLKATALAAGESMIGLDIVGDTVDSTGGVIRLIELDKTGVGSAEVHGIHIEPEIAEVIHHASGIFIDPTQGWDENGGFASTTHAFSSSAVDVTIFNADNDIIYIGSDAVFQEVEVILNTGASNPGIKPNFAISTAGAYAAITPIDNTAGFRESGLIDLEDVDLSSWAATSTNGVSKFYLRITRTQNSLGTDPIEDLIQTAAVTDYIWTGDGVLNLNSISVSSSTLGTVTSGIWNGTAIDISDYTNAASGDGVTVNGDAFDFDCSDVTDSGNDGISCSTQDIVVGGGRSLTVDATNVIADAELYVYDDCRFIEDPTADDDLNSIWRVKLAMTITEIWAESDQTVTFNLQEDDGSPANIMDISIAPAAGETSTTTFADASIAAGSEIDLVVDSVGSTPTWLSICIFGDYND